MKTWLLTAIVAVALACNGARARGDEAAPSGGFAARTEAGAASFLPIDLSRAAWHVKYGFSPEDADGFDGDAPGVVAVREFPISPFSLTPVPPHLPAYHFALMAGFDVPPAPLPPLSLLLFFLGENWAIYLNGQLLRSEVHLAANGAMRRRRTLFQPMFPIPERFLRPGRNTLVLHLIGSPLVSPWSVGHHVNIAAEEFLIADTASVIRRRGTDVTVAMNWVYLFFGLFYLGLYLKRRTDPHPLYFGGFAVLYAIVEFTGSSYLTESLSDTTWLFRARWLAMALTAPALAAFMHTYFFRERRYPPQVQAVIAVGIAFALWFVVAPFAYAMSAVMVWQYQMLLVVPIIFWTPASAWKQGRPHARAVTLAAFCLGATVIADLVVDTLTFYEPHLSQFALVLLILTLAMVIAIRFMDLQESTEQFSSLLQAQRDSFARFVPTQFLELLGRHSGQDIRLGDNSLRPMSVLFSDIRGFTSLSETMNPQDNFEFLNSYLKHMEPIIKEHGGFVDKFLGDGLMALFAETEDQHKPIGERNTSSDRAVAAAIAMQRELANYNEKWARNGYRAIQIGIGINWGDVILGTVGSDNRLDTTVVGDTVNVAQRLERESARFSVGIVVSEGTRKRLTRPETHCARRVGEVVLRGKERAMNVFEIFDHEDEAPRSRRVQSGPLLEAALDAVRRNRPGEARAALEKARASDPQDPVLNRYLRELAGDPHE
jgi:adenylate cyclase